jgi:hypothetical protein
MDYQEQEDYISEWWRLADELSVHEAALLIVGVDPNSKTGSHCKDWKRHEQPDGYGAVIRGIGSVLDRKVKGVHVPYYETDINGNRTHAIDGSTNTDESSVNVESLIAWLRIRGYETGFFFPTKAVESGPAYLDKTHPRYAPKLAALVSAWLEFEDVPGKTVKQSIERWLRANAGRYGLTDDEGNPMGTTITALSAVANWKFGGAANTPG